MQGEQGPWDSAQGIEVKELQMDQGWGPRARCMTNRVVWIRAGGPGCMANRVVWSSAFRHA